MFIKPKFYSWNAFQKVIKNAIFELLLITIQQLTRDVAARLPIYFTLRNRVGKHNISYYSLKLYSHLLLSWDPKKNNHSFYLIQSTNILFLWMHKIKTKIFLFFMLLSALFVLRIKMFRPYSPPFPLPPWSFFPPYLLHASTIPASENKCIRKFNPSALCDVFTAQTSSSKRTFYTHFLSLVVIPVSALPLA